MAKCRTVIQENQELGKQISQGRVAQLEAEIALQMKRYEEIKSSQDGEYTSHFTLVSVCTYSPVHIIIHILYNSLLLTCPLYKEVRLYTYMHTHLNDLLFFFLYLQNLVSLCFSWTKKLRACSPKC